MSWIDVEVDKINEVVKIGFRAIYLLFDDLRQGFILISLVTHLHIFT